MSRANLVSLLDDLARLDDGEGPAERIDSARAQAILLCVFEGSG